MQKTRWQSRTNPPQWIAVKWRIYLTPPALWTNGSILFRCFGKLQESITKALSFPQDESSGSGLAKSVSIQSHRIHVKGIFTYIWLIFMVNVGKYASHMDPMGVDDSKKQMSCESCCFNLFPKNSWWLIPLPIHPSIYPKTSIIPVELPWSRSKWHDLELWRLSRPIWRTKNHEKTREHTFIANSSPLKIEWLENVGRLWSYWSSAYFWRTFCCLFLREGVNSKENKTL